MEELLTPRELANMMKVTPACIRNWRLAGMPTEIKSPPRYVLKDVKLWLEFRSNEKKNTSEK